jgi:hypothetical protein
MRTKLLSGVILIILTFVLFGCKTKPSPSASPLDSPSSSSQSPISTPEMDKIRPFQLDKPIEVGATQVTGSGPAGVPIMLVDITLGGPILALGTIDQRGEFDLGLAQPLEARHRIGIALGSLAGTEWQREDFSDEGFCGDEAFNVPQIGFFFDTYMIRE